MSLLLIASQTSFIGCVVVGLERLCPAFHDGCVEYFLVVAVNASMAVLSSSHVECMRVCVCTSGSSCSSSLTLNHTEQYPSKPSVFLPFNIHASGSSAWPLNHA
jgi:hypothetical protein